MMDFNAVPLPLSLQAELAEQRQRRPRPIKERPARKDDEVGSDPDDAGSDAEAVDNRKVIETNLKALR